jgi:hypothetical protein
MPNFKVGDEVLLDEETLRNNNVSYQSDWLYRAVITELCDYQGWFSNSYKIEFMEGPMQGKYIYVGYSYDYCLIGLPTVPKKRTGLRY